MNFFMISNYNNKKFYSIRVNEAPLDASSKMYHEMNIEIKLVESLSTQFHFFLFLTKNYMNFK